MLSEEDKRQILSGIRYVYRLYNPVALDLSTGELSLIVPWWKRLICKVNYVFFLCHTIFKILRLLQTFLYEKEITELYEFIIHINFVCGMIAIAFSYYFPFIEYPDIHATVVKFSLSPRNHDGNNCTSSCKAFAVNELYSCSIRNLQKLILKLVDPVGAGKGRKIRDLFQRSLQDLVALYAPHMVIAGGLTGFLCFLYAPTLSAWLYSSVPAKYQGYTWFAVCLVVEAHWLSFVAIHSSSSFQIHVVFFDGIHRELQMVARSVISKYELSSG